MIEIQILKSACDLFTRNFKCPPLGVCTPSVGKSKSEGESESNSLIVASRQCEHNNTNAFYLSNDVAFTSVEVLNRQLDVLQIQFLFCQICLEKFRRGWTEKTQKQAFLGGSLVAKR